MTPSSHPSPAREDAAQGQHVDALGNALQVGDVLEYDFFTGEKVTITRLLSRNRFAFADRETERTNFCRCFIRVATQAQASADTYTLQRVSDLLQTGHRWARLSGQFATLEGGAA